MFEGKPALVSNSSSGIGQAIAEPFGACSANVGISCYRNEEGADVAAAYVESAGGWAV